MDNNSIKIYVPRFCYEAFLKAIEYLQETKHKIEITDEGFEKNKNRCFFIVKSKDNKDFYYLGRQYESEKEKL